MRALRRMIAALAILLAAPALAQPAWRPADGDRLEFDVYRDGAKLGKHLVVFRRSGEELTVDSDIELKVALGPITLFHYVQDVTERYLGDRLVFVSAKTKKDGKWKSLAAEAVVGGLKVAGEAFKGLRTDLVIPSTHWNIEEMRQPGMFSTETGATIPMTVTDQGMEQVKTGAGMVEARRFLVKSEMNATFWYDAEGRWVKCAFKAQGSNVDYVLRRLPS